MEVFFHRRSARSIFKSNQNVKRNNLILLTSCLVNLSNLVSITSNDVTKILKREICKSLSNIYHKR